MPSGVCAAEPRSSAACKLKASLQFYAYAVGLCSAENNFFALLVHNCQLSDSCSRCCVAHHGRANSCCITANDPMQMGRVWALVYVEVRPRGGEAPPLLRALRALRSCIS